MVQFVLIAFVVLFAAMNLFLINAREKQKDCEEIALKKIEVKGLCLNKKTKTESGVIGIDQKNEKLILINSSLSKTLDTKIFSFKDIFSCELIIDNEIIYKKSAIRTVGRTLVGGAIMGGVGALVGGLSGSAKKKAQIKKIELKIVVKDLSNPTQKFIFLGDSSFQDSSKQRLEEAEQWKDIISLIIDMEDNKSK